MNDEGVGVIWPGVSVEVVDEKHRPIEELEGNVRIKSAGCASEYLDDPVATREKFRDGWFYPGDLGVMLGPRTLKILGRADDILNVRGVKFLPYDAEKRMMAALEIKDVCISTVADAEKNTQICIAVVPDEGQDIAQLAKQLSKYISPKFGPFQVVPMGSLPRTATGKIRRNELSAGLADYLRRKGAKGF
jgi:acyl-CoA synthetase (AMP-forming)/AMP-acid ligase II